MVHKHHVTSRDSSRVAKPEKVYFRSQILDRPSIGEYWNIFGVPVLPENVIFTFFRTCWCYLELTILEHKKGLVLSNTRVPVSGTWSILFPPNLIIFWLHTTLYGSAAGCRSIQKTCAFWKNGLTFENTQSQLTYFCKSNINQTFTNGNGMIWGVMIAIFTEIRHLVEELITFLYFLDLRNWAFWQLD